MGYPRGGTKEYGRVKPLTDLERTFRELLRLPGIGRLQHGNLRREGVIPVVLLVLGAVHFGVIGRNDDEAAPNARVGRREEGVGRHVQPHVLHGRKGPRPREGCAEAHLHRHLLVGGPLGVHSLVAREDFQDLCGRGPRIGRRNPHPGFECAQGDRLVS